MTINPLYIPLFEIETIINDKDTGLPLSGGVVKFYRDSQRVSPKPVYQISGSSPDYTFESIGNELTLGICGSFVDVDGNPIVPYAYPYDADGALDLYYVTVESAGGVSQFVREAVPYTGSGSISPEQRSNTDNELINPQFVEVLFPSTGTTTLNVTGSNTVTPIAPGWDLITSGTGTVDVERLEPTAAGVVTNPPYALRIEAAAALGATISLRQRLLNSPSLMRGDYVSGTLTAAVLSGGGSSLSMSYAPSTGTATTIIASTSVSTDGAYHTLADNNPVPDQANDAASTGYIDIIITIPTSRSISITSIQVVGVAYSVDIPFDEQSTQRQKSQLFSYYEDSILNQPKESLLTGWNFALNPWQFRSSASSNVANNTYTADQTIIVQQAYVDSATGNNVAVSRGTAAQNYAFMVTAVTAANKFAVIQYIDPATIRPYWGENLSAMVYCNLSSPTHASTVRVKMRLIYRTTTLPPTIAQDEPISAWTDVAGSDPTFKSGWTAITPLNDPIYTLTVGENVFYPFHQFTLPASSNDNMTLGLVIYTLDDMDETATADEILFNRISLVPNDFAIDCNTETYDESLRKCQYYYEKSYPNGVLPAASSTNGLINIVCRGDTDGSSTTVYPTRFNIDFMQVKRATPSMTIYTPAGTAANISVGVVDFNNNVVSAAANKALTQWTLTDSSASRMTYYTNATTTAIYSVGSSHTTYEGFMQFNYVADSRLGV